MGITEERIKRITEQAAAMKKIGKMSVDVSGELDALVSDNAAMEAEIQGLNEANDSLRERLNRGENHDGFMKLPLDADGEPIRLGDTVWYIGVDVGIEKDCPMEVNGFVRVPFALETFIETLECPRKAIASESLTHKRPEPHDSWEKLEEDAMGRACELAGSGNLRCGDCEWGKEGIGCQAMARLEILKRAKKLAGIEKLEGEER